MPEAARNISQVPPATTDSTSQVQEQAPIPVYERQPGEPILWFNRFKLYRGLGPKRTVQAALAKERANIKALESTETGQKPGADVSISKSAARVRKPAGTQEKRLIEVPKPVPAVPGSWKQASIKYRWVERCIAYDVDRVDRIIEIHMNDLIEGPATVFNRVMMLKQLLESTRVNFNANATLMNLEQYCMMMQRMQSLLKQIADEMSGYDEAVTRAILRPQIERDYRDGTLLKQAVKELKEAVASPDGHDLQGMIDAIEQEMRRRGPPAQRRKE